MATAGLTGRIEPWRGEVVAELREELRSVPLLVCWGGC